MHLLTHPQTLFGWKKLWKINLTFNILNRWNLLKLIQKLNVLTSFKTRPPLLWLMSKTFVLPKYINILPNIVNSVCLTPDSNLMEELLKHTNIVKSLHEWKNTARSYFWRVLKLIHKLLFTLILLTALGSAASKVAPKTFNLCMN